MAYNFAKRLKTLNGLTPYEYLCRCWQVAKMRSAQPIGHEARHLGEALGPVNRRKPVLEREGSDSAEVLCRDPGEDDEGTSALADRRLEGGLELLRISHGQEGRVHA
jgi:hypothetical protein